MRTAFPLVLSLVAIGCSQTPSPQAPTSPNAFDPRPFTRDQPACLVVSDASGSITARTDEARCGTRYRPYSTFKIPNTIVGLETGVLQDATTVIPWDRQKYPEQAWWPSVWTERDHDLRSAFHHSFVPYYRALASRVGSEAMQRYVNQFHYGNQNIGGGLDSFWLDGSIAISAEEQVRFLRAFYHGDLGVSDRTTGIVKDILVHERAGQHVLSAKTGTGDGSEGGSLGWVVGYVERGEDVHFYAFNVSGKTFEDIERQWRFDALKQMLHALALWPDP
jgi:beta-lactamase class D